MTFEDKVNMVLEELKHTLVSKNKKYGNSALDPVRVFSKASPKEQILVRLDDKLSRLRTQHISEDEDVSTDLMGYLVLLKIADMEEPLDIEKIIDGYTYPNLEITEPIVEESELTYAEHLSGKQEIEVRELLRTTMYFIKSWGDAGIIVAKRGKKDDEIDLKDMFWFKTYEEVMAWCDKLKKDK